MNKKHFPYSHIYLTGFKCSSTHLTRYWRVVWHCSAPFCCIAIIKPGLLNICFCSWTMRLMKCLCHKQNTRSMKLTEVTQWNHSIHHTGVHFPLMQYRHLDKIKLTTHTHTPDAASGQTNGILDPCFAIKSVSSLPTNIVSQHPCKPYCYVLLASSGTAQTLLRLRNSQLIWTKLIYYIMIFIITIGV
jgi:hypothetical protein